MFGAAVDDAIRAHAEAAFPAESCGLVLRGDDGKARYRRYENTADAPQMAFRIHPDALLQAQVDGDLLAVAHSHPPPAPACPSMPDMQAQSDMALPWAIAPVGEGGDAAVPFWFGEQAPRPWLAATGKNPLDALLGLPYRHGVTDCYSLCRDYYRMAHGLLLPEQPRGWGATGPGVNEYDWYALLHGRFGFAEVPPSEARVGDALLIQIGSRFINHAAVLVAPGIILHHPGGDRAWDPTRLSRRDAASRWMAHVRKVIRHQSRFEPAEKDD